MAYHKTLYGEATTRFRYSKNNGTNERQREILGNQLEKFFDSTGLQPRGAQGLLPPEGMTDRQKEVFDDILRSFMENSRSTAEIQKDFSKLDEAQKIISVEQEDGSKEKKKAKSITEKEEALFKKARIASDERLHKEIYSKIIKEIWGLSTDNKWDTDAVYKAMVDTLDEVDNGKLADDERAYVNSVKNKMRSGLY